MHTAWLYESECQLSTSLGNPCSHKVETDDERGIHDFLAASNRYPSEGTAFFNAPHFNEIMKEGICHGCCHRTVYWQDDHASMSDFWMFNKPQKSITLTCIYKTQAELNNEKGKRFVDEAKAVYHTDSTNAVLNRYRASTPFCQAAYHACGDCSFSSIQYEWHVPNDLLDKSSPYMYDVRRDSLRFEVRSAPAASEFKIEDAPIMTEKTPTVEIKCLPNKWKLRSRPGTTMMSLQMISPRKPDEAVSSITSGRRFYIQVTLPHGHFDTSKYKYTIFADVALEVLETGCLNNKKVTQSRECGAKKFDKKDDGAEGKGKLLLEENHGEWKGEITKDIESKKFYKEKGATAQFLLSGSLSWKDLDPKCKDESSKDTWEECFHPIMIRIGARIKIKTTALDSEDSVDNTDVYDSSTDVLLTPDLHRSSGRHPCSRILPKTVEYRNKEQGRWFEPIPF